MTPSSSVELEFRNVCLFPEKEMAALRLPKLSKSYRVGIFLMVFFSFYFTIFLRTNRKSFCINLFTLITKTFGRFKFRTKFCPKNKNVQNLLCPKSKSVRNLYLLHRYLMKIFLFQLYFILVTLIEVQLQVILVEIFSKGVRRSSIFLRMNDLHKVSKIKG